MKHELIVPFDEVGAVIINLFEGGVEEVDAVRYTEEGLYRITWEDKHEGVDSV